jgi:hypothetical protein
MNDILHSKAIMFNYSMHVVNKACDLLDISPAVQNKFDYINTFSMTWIFYQTNIACFRNLKKQLEKTDKYRQDVEQFEQSSSSTYTDLQKVKHEIEQLKKQSKFPMDLDTSFLSITIVQLVLILRISWDTEASCLFKHYLFMFQQHLISVRCSRKIK